MSRRPPSGVGGLGAIGAAVLAAAVVAGGFALERGLGPRPLVASDVPHEISGAWFCPHGGGEGWAAWVVVANPSAEPADLQIVTLGSKRPTAQTLQVAAGAQVYVESAAVEEGSSTSVEFFGGPVTAGFVVTKPGGGLASEPCLARSARRWVLTEATTLRGFDERIVIMNPFAERAVFDVVLTTEDDLLRPGELAGQVLEARRSIAFDLGAFALEKRTLTVTVNVDIGKVAAAGLGITETGLRATLPAGDPSRRWVLPGAGEEVASAVTVTTPAPDPAPLRIRVQGADGQTEVLSEAEAPAFRGSTFEVSAPDAGIVVVAEGERGFVAQRRMQREGEEASTGGVPEGAQRWVAHPVVPPAGGLSSLLIQNAGRETAEVRLRLLTFEGPAEAPSIARMVLPAGHQRAIPLGDLVGEVPVSVLVEAETGRVVVGQFSISAAGYAVAVGTPL